MSDSEISEEVVKPKRAPRKRVAKTAVKKAAPKPRKTAAKKAPVKRVKKAPKVPKETQEEVVPEVVESAPRKAPTVFASQKQNKKQQQKHAIIIGLIVCVGIGASAAVGYTDKGQISVAQIIEDRNQQVDNGTSNDESDGPGAISVPVQNTSKQANGGLVGLGTGGAKPKPPVEVSTTTASTTDSVASSTDPVASSTAETSDSESGSATTSPEVTDEQVQEAPEEPVQQSGSSDAPDVSTETATTS
jgi:hypothetical protein